MNYSFSLKITIIFFLAFYISASDPWVCTPDNTHKCPNQNQTCCPSIHAASKYVCFDSPNGVCCPDDQNFCPNGTVCNMIDLKCDPVTPALNFLSIPEETEPVTEFTHALENNSALNTTVSGDDILKFSLGFYRGLGMFSDLPNEHDCLDKVANPKISQDLIEIYNLVKQLNSQSDFIDIFKQVGFYAVDIYFIVSEAISPCKEWSQELKQTGEKVLNIFKEDKYIEKLGMHVLLYIGEYRDRAVKGYNAILSGDYFAAGESFGDLIKFGLFWEFKN